MVPAILAVGVGPLLSWKRADLLGALQRVWAAYIAAVLAVMVAWYLTHGGPIFAVLGFGLAAWTGTAVIVEWAERVRLFRTGLGDSVRRAIHLPRAAYGMTFAHFGLAVSIAGFAASAFDVEAIDTVHAGSLVKLAGYELRFVGVQREPGPNYTANRSTVEITRNGQLVATVHPEQRFFPLQQQTTSETAIRTNFLSDLYIALGDGDAAGNWTLRAYWKPLVPWIWIGAIIMAFGGMVSLSDRRWRVGVAARARRMAPVLQPAPGE
jgi:cytochrome c-type biogenesis protein CcmF